MDMIFRFVGGCRDGTAISCDGHPAAKYVFLTAGGTVGHRLREFSPDSDEILSQAVWRMLQDKDAVELGLQQYAGQQKSALDLLGIARNIIARGFDDPLTERLLAEMCLAASTKSLLQEQIDKAKLWATKPNGSRRTNAEQDILQQR